MSRFKPPKTFDALRALYPTYRIAAYALVPGGPVTLEVMGPNDDSRHKQVVGATFDKALALLFAAAKPPRKRRSPAPAPAPAAPVPDDDEDPLG